MHLLSFFLFFPDELKWICKELFDHMLACESQKYDMEFAVLKKTFEVCSKYHLQFDSLKQIFNTSTEQHFPVKPKFDLEAHLI